MIELSVNLPVPTLIEQIELNFHQEEQKFALAGKYLKLAGVTKRQMVRKTGAREEENRIGEDIQITVEGQTTEQKKAAKYLKLKSGYLDREKKMLELNYLGGVCNQLNVQFDFNVEQARALIRECAALVANVHSKEEAGGARRQEGQKNPRAGGTPGQLASSYRKEGYFEAEASELDDLDQEVSNFVKNWQKGSNGHDDREERDKSESALKHEEIKIQLLDEDNKASGQTGFSAEEAQKLQEHKLFEGQNVALWASRLVQHVLQNIKIIGFNMNKVPAITNLAHLMNMSFELRREKTRVEDALEVDFLLGTLLISTKRNTQAVEVLRSKVQKPYLQQVQINLDRLQRDELGIEDKQKLKIQNRKLYTRSAMVELLCSESMCIRPQINDKLRSLTRMTQLCRGQMVEIIS